MGLGSYRFQYSLGLLAIPPRAFHGHEEVDLESVPRHERDLKSDGFLLARFQTSGETFLQVRESWQITQRWEQPRSPIQVRPYPLMMNHWPRQVCLSLERSDSTRRATFQGFRIRPMVSLRCALFHNAWPLR